MNLYEKITKETDDSTLYELLGSVMYANIIDLYNRLKKGEIHPTFYKDYLSGKELDKWFVSELLENEDHIDFNNPVSESDYSEILSQINEGYSNSDALTHLIGGITDAHIGDCSFQN